MLRPGARGCLSWPKDLASGLLRISVCWCSWLIHLFQVPNCLVASVIISGPRQLDLRGADLQAASGTVAASNKAPAFEMAPARFDQWWTWTDEIYGEHCGAPVGQLCSSLTVPAFECVAASFLDLRSICLIGCVVWYRTCRNANSLNLLAAVSVAGDGVEPTCLGLKIKVPMSKCNFVIHWNISEKHAYNMIGTCWDCGSSICWCLQSV